MEQIVLVRYGEIILKGLNRPVFEKKLIFNINNVLKEENAKVFYSQARIYVEKKEKEKDFNINSIINKLKKVFGIISVSPAYKVSSNLDDIYKATTKCVTDRYDTKTFKVESKRGDKSFELKSPEINRVVGEYVLQNFNNLSVDVHHPDMIINIEVREFSYVYTEVIQCFGGMPVGTNGKACLLISGGIDSPVAGWQIAKRGVNLVAVHFASPPYTGDKAKEKVKRLTELVSEYAGSINLHIVEFTNIQLELRAKCPYDQITILMRRFMMKISEKIAINEGCQALITGESIGQVASQTMESLVVTNSAVNMPIFRPLIGLDKNEIVDIARKIDTYETSILPYEDCCTVFLPDRPETKPKLDKIEIFEKNIDIDALINEAIEKTEIIRIGS